VAQERRPTRPPEINFTLLDEDDFEELCVLIVLLEHENAQRIRAPDLGADAVLPGEPGTFERCWQAKRFTSRIYWDQCEASLDRGRENYHPERYTFMFATDLTGPQRRTLTTRLQQRHRDIAIDYVDRTTLLGKLLATREGERIAGHFFEDPNVNGSALMAAIRAMQAGGALETAADVSARLRAIAEFLDGYDPYFIYTPSARPAGQPAPLVPGSILARETISEEMIDRLDVVPRSRDVMEQAAPGFRLLFDETPEGQALLARLKMILTEGGELELGDAAVIEFTQVPKLFQDELGEPMRGGVISITPHHPPIPVRLTIRSAGTLTYTRDLDLVRCPPAEGWDASLRGTLPGLEIMLSLRRRGEGGQGRLTWSLLSEPVSNRDRLLALEGTLAIHQAGTLQVEHRDEGTSLFTQPLVDRGPPDWLPASQAVVSAVVDIEQWLGTSLELPEELDRPGLKVLAETSYIVRERKSRMSFEKIGLLVPPEKFDFTVAEHDLRIETGLQVRLFGQELYFGRLVGNVRARTISAGEPDAEGKIPVEIGPASDADASPEFVLVRDSEPR
jgi:hypothetical protein